MLIPSLTTRQGFPCLVFFCILFLGAWLRFHDLASMTIHADEATGAKILSQRLEGHVYRFNPHHFHGPTLSLGSVPIAITFGETHWTQLQAATLRLLPALCGTFIIALLWLWRARLGTIGTLTAALFVATSPLLVTYSRVYIHEMLLGFFAMLSLTLLQLKVSTQKLGYLVGSSASLALMYATKETFIISVGVWSIALLMIATFQPKHRANLFLNIKILETQRLKIISLCVVTFTLISALLYSDGFRHLGALSDAITTFTNYETTSGHEKPWFTYLELLFWPKHSAGRLWQETLLCLPLLLLLPFMIGIKIWSKLQFHHAFLWWSSLGHLMAYSIIAYKTPWLMVVPVIHLCLLAGACLDAVLKQWPKSSIFFSLTLLASAVFQTQTSLASIHQVPNDTRNPYIYVPTSSDSNKLKDMLNVWQSQIASSESLKLAVLGEQIWPLPWILRGTKTGYWSTLPPLNLIQNMAVVITMPAVGESLYEILNTSHQFVFIGLRAEVPISCYIRHDLWEIWLNRTRDSIK